VRRNWSGTFAFDGLPKLLSKFILHFPFSLTSGEHMPSLLSYNVQLSKTGLFFPSSTPQIILKAFNASPAGVAPSYLNSGIA